MNQTVGYGRYLLGSGFFCYFSRALKFLFSWTVVRGSGLTRAHCDWLITLMAILNRCFVVIGCFISSCFCRAACALCWLSRTVTTMCMTSDADAGRSSLALSRRWRTWKSGIKCWSNAYWLNFWSWLSSNLTKLSVPVLTIVPPRPWHLYPAAKQRIACMIICRGNLF